MQGERGEDSWGSLPGRRHGHDARRPGRDSLCVHLCWGWQAEGDEQADDVHQVLFKHPLLIPKYPIWSQLQFVSQLLLLTQEVTSKAFEVAFLITAVCYLR